MAESIITLQGVSKHFGPVRAVDGVSFEIHRGEFFSLLGPSGCGKTTLLRILAGFELPTAGEIFQERAHLRPSASRVTTATPGTSGRRNASAGPLSLPSISINVPAEVMQISARSTPSIASYSSRFDT